MQNDEFVCGYRERAPEEQRQFEEQMATDLAQSAVMRGKLRVRVEPATVTAEWDADVPGFAAVDHGRMTATLPGVPPNLLKLHSDTRFGPWLMEAAQREDLTYEIIAPQEFDRLVMSPPRANWLSQAGRIQFRSFDFTRQGSTGTEPGTVLRVERSVRLEPAVFPAADIPRLMEINRELSHPRNETIMLERVPAANAEAAALPAAA